MLRIQDLPLSPCIPAITLMLAGTIQAFGSPQGTTLLSVDSGGVQSDLGASSPSATNDGRLIVFESDSATLVAGDTNGDTDVFLHNRNNGNTVRLSVDAGGTEGDRDSENPFISATGAFIVYESDATNIAGGGSAFTDVFLIEGATGTTSLISVDSAGNVANNRCFDATVSNDGRYVAFAANASNLTGTDTNALTDCFVHDRLTQTTVCVSLNHLGTNTGNGVSMLPVVSGDGEYVAFESRAEDLVPNDGNGFSDVFLYEIATGQTTRISEALGGGDANGKSQFVGFSRNGRYLTFQSFANDLVAVDLNFGGFDVFVYDTTGGSMSLESLATGDLPISGSGTTGTISNDGRFVAFRTDSVNLPGGSNGENQIYLRDRTLGVTYPISVTPNGALSNGFTLEGEVLGDGSGVVFSSIADDVIASDTNGTLEDIFLRVPTNASWTLYGSGLAGNLGLPTMDLSANPVLGTSLSLDVTRSSIDNTTGFFFVGLDSADISTNWGASILVDFDFIFPLPLAAVSQTFQFTLDDDPAWEGVEIYVQLLHPDKDAPAGIAFSRGLQMVLGY